MRPLPKLAAFAALLGLAFGAGFGIGELAAPSSGDEPSHTTDGHP